MLLFFLITAFALQRSHRAVVLDPTGAIDSPLGASDGSTESVSLVPACRFSQEFDLGELSSCTIPKCIPPGDVDGFEPRFTATRLFTGDCPIEQELLKCRDYVPILPPVCENWNLTEAEAWGNWSDCSLTCGGGRQWRRRNLDIEKLNRCGFCDIEYRSCNTKRCGSSCILGSWSDWSSCSVSCYPEGAGANADVVGYESRSRAVIVQGYEPGKVCQRDDYLQIRSCHNISGCPINCNVTEWSSWSKCDVDCGCGKQYKTRSVLAAANSYGKQCPSLKEERTCQCDPCPRECQLSEWTVSGCSGDCQEPGVSIPRRRKTRYVIQDSIPPGNCSAPCALTVEEFCYWLPNCSGDCVLSNWTSWYNTCPDCVPYGETAPVRFRTRSVQILGNGVCGCRREEQVCDVPWCCENCTMSDWSPWSVCRQQKTCSNDTSVPGVMERTREVIRPSRACGKACESEVEYKPCSACCPVDCQVSSWTTSLCSFPNGTAIPCGTIPGKKTWKRRILVNATSCGAPCPAVNEYTQDCYPDQVCCPTDCKMSDWNVSECYGCGDNSVRWMSRSIIQEASCGGTPCCVDPTDCAKFKQEKCPNPPKCPPPQCIYSVYGDYDLCPACVAEGEPQAYQCRKRQLVQNATGQVLPDGTVLNCSESLTDCIPCRSCPCPRNCNYSDWGSWSTCDATCGDGFKKRTRKIHWTAANGGVLCPPDTEYAPCNIVNCSINCQISQWSEWSLCPSCLLNNLPAGKTRYRTILRQSAYGGLDCPNTTDSGFCNRTECPRDCAVSEWGAWSNCSVTCGFGFVTRRRAVKTYPSETGLPCPSLQENNYCSRDCPHCIYGPPSEGPCNATCGAPGTVYRTYYSTGQLTTIAVADSNKTYAICPPVVEIHKCSVPCCPVDCVVGPWSLWTPCVDGVKYRSRNVTQPICGGLACPDCLLEKDTCTYVPPPNECEIGQACEEGDVTPVTVVL